MVREGSSFRIDGSSANLLKARTSVDRLFSSFTW